MNAKKEFLEEIKGKELVCAKIGVDTVNYGSEIRWFTLKDNYTDKELEEFCDKLDFEYDDGYGTQELIQELVGTILFKDSYSDRGEYDGSEWWSNHKMPSVSEVLNN